MSSPIIVSANAIICRYSKLRGGVEQSKRQSSLSIMSVDEQVKKSDEAFIHLRDRRDGLICLASTTKEDMGRNRKYTPPQNHHQGLHDFRGHRGGDEEWEGTDYWGNSYFNKPKEEEFLIFDDEEKGKGEKDFYWTYKDSEYLNIAEKLGKVSTIDDWEEGNKTVTRKVIHVTGAYNESILSAHPQMCSFNATKEYLRSLFGITLSNSDEKWYENNALCEKEGLPLPYACTVLNDLVEPYGIGISRVRIHAGLSTHADAPDWMACLGINPMAKTDSTFSNAKFIDLMVQSEIDGAIAAGKPLTADEIKAMQQQLWKHANENYRFEFHENPLRGCVLLYAMGSKGTGNRAVNYASGHGHSEYFSPRCETPDRWKASIQFARKENITYKAVPPVSPPPKIEKRLIPWECKIFGERMGNYRVSAFLEDAMIKHGLTKKPEEKEEERPVNSVRTLTDSEPEIAPIYQIDSLAVMMIDRIVNKICRSLSAFRIGGTGVKLDVLCADISQDVREGQLSYAERVALCKEIGKIAGIPAGIATDLSLFIHHQFKRV